MLSKNSQFFRFSIKVLLVNGDMIASFLFEKSFYLSQNFFLYISDFRSVFRILLLKTSKGKLN